MNVVSIVILGIFTLFLMWFSWWVSLKERRLHGGYRFFSFESILILVWIHLPHWFRNPLSWFQLISWLLLTLSLFLALHGFYLLKTKGRSQGRFEDTTSLVTEGAYRFIRHPMYTSLLCLGTGVFFKFPSWTGALLALINLVSLVLTAKTEEQEMKARFGLQYESYMKKTKMFIPSLF